MPDQAQPAQPESQSLVDAERALAKEALAVDTATGRRGVATSEFWSHAAAGLLGGVIAAYGMAKADHSLIYFGGVLAGASSGGYTLGRSLMKAALAQAGQ